MNRGTSGTIELAPVELFSGFQGNASSGAVTTTPSRKQQNKTRASIIRVLFLLGFPWRRVLLMTRESHLPRGFDVSRSPAFGALDTSRQSRNEQVTSQCRVPFVTRKKQLKKHSEKERKKTDAKRFIIFV